MKPKNKSILIELHKIEEGMRNNLVSSDQSIARYLVKAMQILKSRRRSLKMKRSKLSSMLRNPWKCQNLWLLRFQFRVNKKITNLPNKAKMTLRMKTKR